MKIKNILLGTVVGSLSLCGLVSCDNDFLEESHMNIRLRLRIIHLRNWTWQSVFCMGASSICFLVYGVIITIL